MKETFVCCTPECLCRRMLYRDSVSLTPLIQVFRDVLLLCGHWILCCMHIELCGVLAVLWDAQTIWSSAVEQSPSEINRRQRAAIMLVWPPPPPLPPTHPPCRFPFFTTSGPIQVKVTLLLSRCQYQADKSFCFLFFWPDYDYVLSTTVRALNHSLQRYCLYPLVECLLFKFKL